MYGLAKRAMATRVQKEYDAGNLSDEASNRLFAAQPVQNNLNNRINAKAVRQEGGVWPQKQMTATRYEGVSNPDNLASRAAIDTKRIMKHQGHDNAKIVSELRRQADKGVAIKHVNDTVFDGGSNISWYTNSGKPAEWDIELPKKDATSVPRSYGMQPSSSAAKESRALTVRHEIGGEATSQSRMLRALDSEGFSFSNGNQNAFRINDHNNPDVLVGDAKFVNRLSPETQKIFNAKNERNQTGFTNARVNNGQKMHEGQLMNTLRQPGATVSSKTMHDITHTPYFKKPLPNSNELHESLVNMGVLNGADRGSALSDLAARYIKTPFFR